MHRLFAGVSVLALAAVVAFCGDVRAENCRRVVPINAPLVTTYTAPYVAPQALHATTIVPYVERVLVNSDFYFSVGDEYRQLAFAKLIAQELAAIQAQQGKTSPSSPPSPAALGPAPGVVQPPPGKESVIVQPPPPAKAAAISGDGSECKPVTTALPEGLKTFVAEKCQKCHTSGEAKRRLDLTDLETLHTLSLSARDRMFRSAANGRMPKGVKLTDAELNLLNQFATLAESAVFGDQKAAIPKAKE